MNSETIKTKLSSLCAIGLLMVFCVKTQAYNSNVQVMIEDDGPTISDYESAEKACKEFVNGTIPDAVELKKIMAELGDRLKAEYYWSSTVSDNCGAKECRIQIAKLVLTERSENIHNPTGALICVSQEEEK